MATINANPTGASFGTICLNYLQRSRLCTSVSSKKLREKVRSRQYIMTLHAEEEMEDDGLSIFDIERCILTGKVIERQRDAAKAEWKYIVRGQTLSGEVVVTVGKMSPTDKLVFITVYRD